MLGPTSFAYNQDLRCELQCPAYHVQNLLESQPELEGDRLALVDHGPLQPLVVGHQVIQQPPLMRPSVTTYNIFGIGFETLKV